MISASECALCHRCTSSYTCDTGPAIPVLQTSSTASRLRVIAHRAKTIGCTSFLALINCVTWGLTFAQTGTEQLKISGTARVVVVVLFAVCASKTVTSWQHLVSGGARTQIRGNSLATKMHRDLIPNSGAESYASLVLEPLRQLCQAHQWPGPWL